MIPILNRHNSKDIIGRLYMEDGRCLVEFSHDAAITTEVFFSMFNAELGGLNVAKWMTEHY